MSSDLRNPLLENAQFPLYSQVKPEHVNSAVDAMLAKNRMNVAELELLPHYSWENSVAVLEQISDDLSKVWSQVSHLHAVADSDHLRQEYEIAEQKINQYSTEISHNQQLYQAYCAVAADIDGQDITQQKLLKDAIRNFKLAGVALTAADKEQYAQLIKDLSQLAIKFSNNVLDSTDAWSLTIKDEKQLQGLPSHVLQAAHQQDKYIFDLKFPTYYAVMQYAQNRELRQKFYEAYVTRASDCGPHDRKYDNSDLLFQILQKRSQLARLLGFNNYAEYSLAPKMARSTHEVKQFLWDLVAKVRPQAQHEFAELSSFAKQIDGLEKLEPWDVAYYSEKMRLAYFDISDELLRQYFPLEQVLTGLFTVVNKLYGITIRPKKNIEVWHKDVRFFAIVDEHGQDIGYFYLDLFARSKKRGGAWMDECRSRNKISVQQPLQLPIANLVCNFTPPDKDGLVLLNHEEVTTLFHEFGHGLHHLLTKINYPSIAGINGVPWDGVELPSQFLENWCWQKESLVLIARHYKTGEELPTELLNKMLAAKNFQEAMGMIRQLEFALIDFLLHENFEESQNYQQITQALSEVRSKASVVPQVSYNRFLHSFTHVFAGGYAAGYYSYLWAEVLAADAFARFLEEGIFNRNTSLSFLHNILEQGGSREFIDLFIAFRGRPPQVEALLQQRGLV